MMAYAIGLPAMSLFAFNQKRYYALAGGLCEFVLISATILPIEHIFARNLVSCKIVLIFHLVEPD
jgi:hypothetical protein